MAIRAKTRARLLLVLLIGVLLIGGAAGAYFFRQAQIHRATQLALDEGMAAYQDGDYFTGMHRIGTYLNRHPDDTKAAFAYAVCRMHVPEPKAGHLVQAAAHFRRVLDREPTNTEARSHLLEIYTDLEFNTEAMELADKVLVEDPDAPRAVRAKALALLRLRRFDEALPLAQRYTELAPTDVDGHLYLFDIWRGMEKPASLAMDHARKLAEAMPDHPTADLVRAYAYLYSDDRDGCLAAAEDAVRHTGAATTDATYVDHLLRLFEGYGAYDRALAMLEGAVDAEGKPIVSAALVRRLWQAGRIDDLLARVESIDPKNPDTDSEVIALKALALSGQGQKDDAIVLRDALAGRKDDDKAIAWSIVLRRLISDESTQSADMTAACDQAISYVRDQPYFYFLRGEAYSRLKEDELAIRDWKQAAGISRGWSSPLVRIAETYVDTNRPRPAVAFAEEALKRSSSRIDAAVVKVQALWLLSSTTTDSATLKQLLDAAREIQKYSPFNPRTVAAQADLLTRVEGSDAARQFVQSAIDHEPAVSPAALLRLAAVSRSRDLGLEDALVARVNAEAESGANPDTTYVRAVELARAGEVDEARRLIADGLQAADADQRLGWQLMQARFLDAVNSPDALGAWQALIKDHPDNAVVLHQALDSQVLWGDPEAIDSVVEHLREVAGEQSVAWRIARAKRLMQDAKNPADITAAVELLNGIVQTAPDLAEPRQLLAACQEQLGNLSGAIEQLSAASRLQPDSVGLALNLARLLQERGDQDEAKGMLTRIVSHATSTPAQRRQAAALLAAQGENQMAIDTLVDVHGGDDVPADLLLATLYQRTDQPDRVSAICDRLLESPTPAAIEFAARFYAQQNQIDKAEKALDLLESVDVTPAYRALVRASFAQTYQGADQAATQYRAATDAAPDWPVAWVARLGFTLRSGGGDEFVTVLAQAREALPEDPTVGLLAEHQDAIVEAMKTPEHRPLAIAMVESAPYREAAAESLDWLAESTRQQRSPLETAIGLRRLADRSPRFFALQNALAATYLQARRPDDAADVATRAMQAFPQAVEPAWMAAEAFAAAGRWSEVLRVAREWRRRAAEQPLAADLMIAEAHRQLGQPELAITQTEPYVAEASADPKTYAPLIAVRAQSLIAAGKLDDARQLLVPRLADGREWRALWLRLALAAVPDDRIAAGWLEQVQDQTRPDQLEEIAAVGEAWRLLAQRTKNSKSGDPDRDARQQAYHDRAMALLDSVAKAGDATPSVWLAHGIALEQSGQLEAAAEQYRKALQGDPSLHTAHNNLAMVLVNTGGDLDQALDHARQAVLLRPGDPNYLDTLAEVQIASGNADEAVKTWQEALDLQPRSPLLRINLAWALEKAGQHNQALKVLTPVTADPALVAALPAHLRERVEAVRAPLPEGANANP